MGQLSLLFVIAAFLISGIVVYNAGNSADRADEKVWEHQYHVMARDAASTGMSAAARKLALNLNAAWSAGNGALLSDLSATDEEYKGGTYTVTASAATGGCSILSASNYSSTVALHSYIPDGDVIEIRSTGTYEGAIGSDTEQSHEIVGCYLKADWSLFAPPSFNYGFISDDEFTFNGGPTIQALIDGEGHVHSNNRMDLGPQVEIDGHATYTNTGDIHHNTEVVSHGTGSDIPMTPFDAAAFAADNAIPTVCTSGSEICRHESAGFASSGDLTIQPPTIDPDHREGDPFIWYIDGDLTLSGGDHITVPQYTTIVVTGNISISGGAALTVTGQTAQDVYGNNPTPEESRAWVESQLFDGEHSPIAWYGEGSVVLNGTPGVVGNFYVNGDVTLDGGGNGNNTVGSFASTQGDVTANGGGNGNNFWFLQVAEENVIPGVKLPGKQIVRLAIAEWTDPVLDAAP